MANYTDPSISVDFGQFLLQDSLLVPKSLLTYYPLLPLQDKDLILLLRLSNPLFRRGRMTLSEAAAALGVSENEARSLLSPLLAAQVLQPDADGTEFDCRPLFRFLQGCWLNERRCGEKETPGAASGDGLPDKERVLAMSRLYRRFEVELGHSLKYTENEQIRQWMEEDGLPAELIEEALRRAVLQDKATMSYINSILRDWQKKGYNTLEQVLELDTKPQKEKSGKMLSAEKKEEDIYWKQQLAAIEENSYRIR